MGDSATRGKPAPFPEALRAAIAARGVSLEWLHRRLAELGTPLSVATLSYWRSGRRQPEHQTSMDALATLEELLYLPTGDLRSRLRPSRRPGPVGDVRSLGELMGDAEAVREAVEKLGRDPDHHKAMVETSTQVIVDVDQQGRIRSAVTRSVWKALHDGAQAQPFVFRMENLGGAVPEFRAVSGCSLGKPQVDVESGTWAVEVLLERSLRAGETATVEHRVLVPAEAPTETFYEIFLTRRFSEAVLWIRFDPARVPGHCEVYAEDPRTPGTQILSLRGTISAHHVVRNFGPGRVGIRWWW